MTEQGNLTENAAKPESWVDEVGGLMWAYANEDGREDIGGDLAEVGEAEMARQFAQAEGFFRGFLGAAEHVNYAVYLLVGDALDRAREARQALERRAL